MTYQDNTQAEHANPTNTALSPIFGAASTPDLRRRVLLELYRHGPLSRPQLYKAVLGQARDTRLLGPGPFYRLLSTLGREIEPAGETVDPARGGKAYRRYRLTHPGQREAEEALDEHPL